MGLKRFPGAAAVYRDPRWAVVRLEAKRRDGWKCVKCDARGKLEVDHIKPLRTNMELAFDLANLQSMCPSCHSKKTRIEIGLGREDPEREKWKKYMTMESK
jgi:5-methylcytosine-specific restriction protein A